MLASNRVRFPEPQLFRPQRYPGAGRSLPVNCFAKSKLGLGSNFCRFNIQSCQLALENKQTFSFTFTDSRFFYNLAFVAVFVLETFRCCFRVQVNRVLLSLSSFQHLVSNIDKLLSSFLPLFTLIPFELQLTFCSGCCSLI